MFRLSRTTRITGAWGVGHIHQPLHLVSEILHGAALRDGHMSPPRQRVTEQEDVAGAAAPILVVLAPRSSRLGGQRFSHVGQQLGCGLVKAHHRTVGVVGFAVQVQHVFHGRHELPVINDN